MDSVTDKDIKTLPRWTPSKGPSFFSAYLRFMAEFMMRIGLIVFSQPTVVGLPANYPTKDNKDKAAMADLGIDTAFVADEPALLSL